jgi:hypothetical protein
MGTSELHPHFVVVRLDCLKWQHLLAFASLAKLGFSSNFPSHTHAHLNNFDYRWW